IKEGITIEPLFSGGQQERYIRSGTENVPGIVAMTKALRMALEKQQENQEQMRELQKVLRQFFEEIDQVHINSPLQHAPHILNVSCIGLKPEVIVHAL